MCQCRGRIVVLSFVVSSYCSRRIVVVIIYISLPTLALMLSRRPSCIVVYSSTTINKMKFHVVHFFSSSFTFPLPLISIFLSLSFYISIMHIIHSTLLYYDEFVCVLVCESLELFLFLVVLFYFLFLLLLLCVV